MPRFYTSPAAFTRRKLRVRLVSYCAPDIERASQIQACGHTLEHTKNVPGDYHGVVGTGGHVTGLCSRNLLV